MKKKAGKETALYAFVLLIPFVIGGYLVWTSAFAACVLLGILCCSGKSSTRGEGRCLENKDYVMVSTVCLPVMFLFAAVWGVDRGQACFGFVKFMPLPLFLAAVRQLSKESRDRLWDAVPLGGIAMTLVSCVMWCIPVMRDWVQVNRRLAGFFQYPNTYAVYLLCGLLVMAERLSDRMYRNIAGCLVLAAGLFLSGSRTTLVLAGIVTGILLWHSRGNMNIRAVLFVLTGSIAIFLFLLTVTGNLVVLERYLILPTQSSTFLGRLLYAADVLPVIARHPLGLGYMGYYYLQGSFQTGVYTTRYIHNELLQLLLDVGWIPAMVILYAIWKSFWRLGYYKRLLLMVLLLHSLFDFDFQFISMGCILILLLAGEEKKQARLFKRKAVPVGKTRRNDRSLLKRISAMLLAALCLWVGTADFFAYINWPEMVVRIYPLHTESWTKLLAGADTPEEMEQIADRIIKMNQSVFLAYDAKAMVAYFGGDAQKMVEYKLKAIALAKYELAEYEDYFERLFIFCRLYLDAGMESSAAYCRDRLLEIPARLEQVKKNSSPLAWRIYDKPKLELTEEMQRMLIELQDMF